MPFPACAWASAVPVETLVCPLAIVDIRERADADPDALVTPGDLRVWIVVNGPISQVACAVQDAGWQLRLGTPGICNADADGKVHFPAFHVEAATMLPEEAVVAGMAVDTLSIDYGSSADFVTH